MNRPCYDPDIQKWTVYGPERATEHAQRRRHLVEFESTAALAESLNGWSLFLLACLGILV